MTLDTKYIPDTSFQTGIVDKDTGFPLAGGVVKFYKDIARTTPKPVYKLAGTPPSYNYVSLGSEITLSSIGTTQDGSGNDIPIYFYPYDDSGVVDLYYFTVESAGAISQFTREGKPNVAQAEVDAEANVPNYVPNGQFLLHTDIVADSDGGIEAGEITADVTEIAQGGWTFERSTASSAKDIVLFERIGSFTKVPAQSPRYSVRVRNETPDVGDSFKDLRIKFKDVNKFASDDVKYTFAFQAKSNSGSGIPISVKLIKNYGTGGSAEETTILQPLSLGTDYIGADIPFVFGANDGKTIGSLDDDFIQLTISFQTGSVFDITLDNFILTEGDVQVSTFPDTTDEQFTRDALLGPQAIPDYEANNLYLPVRLGKNGFEYDTGIIGDYVFRSTDFIDIGELACDGAKYRVEQFSSDGIPYRRLYTVLAASSAQGLPIYGVGTNEMRLITNRLSTSSPGAVTPAADGAVPTGFTFTPVQPDPYAVDITFVAASGMTAASYFTYHTPDARKFIVWYEISGSGTQPVESANVYRKVQILTGDNVAAVNLKTALAINSYTFEVPDWRGYFLRITDNGAGVDPDAATRTDRGDNTTGDNVGTVQQDELKSHQHAYNNITENPGSYQVGDGGSLRANDTPGTSSAGGNETRPINRYANIAIKY